jgi:hypothetical protein
MFSGQIASERIVGKPVAIRPPTSFSVADGPHNLSDLPKPGCEAGFGFSAIPGSTINLL